jgi:hypothetical protein
MGLFNMTSIVKTVENLAEMLQEYAIEVDDGEHEKHSDDYIVDGLFDMFEVLYADGIEEGRYYQGYMYMTDKPVKLFETVQMQSFLTESPVKLKIMSILGVSPSEKKNGEFMLQILAEKLRD